MSPLSPLAATPLGRDRDLWTPGRRGGTGAGRGPGSPASRTSARALLLTLLGEFVLPSGGQAWTATIIEAMATLGIEAAATRQALARTAAGGLLASERRGRQSVWTLTPAAVALLTEGTGRIYELGRPAPVWDGRWLLVLVTVPESNRPLRYRLRARMAWSGLVPLTGGVWISPWPDREPGVLAALEELDLGAGAASFVGAPGLVGDVEARAAEIWDLAALEARYATFMETTEDAAPAGEEEAFAALLGLVHDWRHFPSADPGLPDRLLPQPWSGRAAAERFHACHDRWAGPAWSWWRART